MVHSRPWSKLDTTEIWYYTSPMAMDKRKRNRQPTMWVTPTDLPTTPSHPPQDVQLGDSERLPGEKPVQDPHEPAIPIEREQPRNRRFENEEDEARLLAANPHLEASSSRCSTRSGRPHQLHQQDPGAHQPEHDQSVSEHPPPWPSGGDEKAGGTPLHNRCTTRNRDLTMIRSPQGELMS
jgi:hypothetical protein